jgi:hypothetical protein
MREVSAFFFVFSNQRMHGKENVLLTKKNYEIIFFFIIYPLPNIVNFDFVLQLRNPCLNEQNIFSGFFLVIVRIIYNIKVVFVSFTRSLLFAL